MSTLSKIQDILNIRHNVLFEIEGKEGTYKMIDNGGGIYSKDYYYDENDNYIRMWNRDDLILIGLISGRYKVKI